MLKCRFWLSVWSGIWDDAFPTNIKMIMLWEAKKKKEVKTQNPILEHMNCETLGLSLLICESEMMYYHVGVLWALNDRVACNKAHDKYSMHWPPSIFYFYYSENWSRFQKMMPTWLFNGETKVCRMQWKVCMLGAGEGGLKSKSREE